MLPAPISVVSPRSHSVFNRSGAKDDIVQSIFLVVSCVCMPNIKSLSFTVHKLWPRLKFFPQTGQKLDAIEFQPGGLNIGDN